MFVLSPLTRLTPPLAPLNSLRQGNDWGPQYQAALFPHGDAQNLVANEALDWARDELRSLLSLTPSSENGGGDGDDASSLQPLPPRNEEGELLGEKALSRGRGRGWEWEGREVRTLVLPTPEREFTEAQDAGEGGAEE